jgi:hypothetical protein
MNIKRIVELMHNVSIYSKINVSVFNLDLYLLNKYIDLSMGIIYSHIFGDQEVI